MSNQTLKSATRRELIEELSRRESITGYHVIQGNGATIKTTSGSIAVEGDAHIFVIKSEMEQACGEMKISFSEERMNEPREAHIGDFGKSESTSRLSSMPFKDISDWSVFFCED